MGSIKPLGVDEGGEGGGEGGGGEGTGEEPIVHTDGPNKGRMNQRHGSFFTAAARRMSRATSSRSSNGEAGEGGEGEGGDDEWWYMTELALHGPFSGAYIWEWLKNGYV